MSRNLVAIQADASKRGLGAVLIQEGSPIAYASRTMTATQERYAQIEKRTISCCICLRTISPVHQWKISPCSIRPQAAGKHNEEAFIYSTRYRLQRMLLRLQKYDINLIYKPGKELKIADTSSRAQLAEAAEEIREEQMQSQIHLVYANLPISDQEVKDKTSRDQRNLFK